VRPVPAPSMSLDLAVLDGAPVGSVESCNSGKDCGVTRYGKALVASQSAVNFREFENAAVTTDPLHLATEGRSEVAECCIVGTSLRMWSGSG
jgi:hypothetical protein